MSVERDKTHTGIFKFNLKKQTSPVAVCTAKLSEAFHVLGALTICFTNMHGTSSAQHPLNPKLQGTETYIIF